jgi:hypothetical protein
MLALLFALVWQDQHRSIQQDSDCSRRSCWRRRLPRSVQVFLSGIHAAQLIDHSSAVVLAQAANGAGPVCAFLPRDDLHVSAYSGICTSASTAASSTALLKVAFAEQCVEPRRHLQSQLYWCCSRGGSPPCGDRLQWLCGGDCSGTCGDDCSGTQQWLLVSGRDPARSGAGRQPQPHTPLAMRDPLVQRLRCLAD